MNIDDFNNNPLAKCLCYLFFVLAMTLVMFLVTIILIPNMRPVFVGVVAFTELIASSILVHSVLKKTETKNEADIYQRNAFVESKKKYPNNEIKEGEKELKRLERLKQCDTFTIDDMYQFSDIPIAWSNINELKHTYGIAWSVVNWNNKKIVLDYISEINEIIVDSHSYIDGIDNIYIDIDAIDFDYPKPMRLNSMCRTRIECYPYTPSGKVSKYPVVIHFEAIDHSSTYTLGEIKILRDGNIGDAMVAIKEYKFKIGVHGRSLVLKRVDSLHNGNLFDFYEIIN